MKRYVGGCACGSVRYDVSGEPVLMGDCQCRQCQRDSGTGHSSYLTFVGAAVKVDGVVSRWEVTGDGGTVKSRAFCRTCGTLVYMAFPTKPDYFIIRPGTLDDPSVYKPQMVFWASAGHAWDMLDPAVPKFDRMPPPRAL